MKELKNHSIHAAKVESMYAMYVRSWKKIHKTKILLIFYTKWMSSS